MRYKSDAYEAIHEDAVSMFEVGAISAERMLEYDKMCLVQEDEAVDDNHLSMEIEHITA